VANERERVKQTDDRRFHEETGAEIAPRLQPPMENREKIQREDIPDEALQEVQEGAGNGTALGITGLILALASLFMLPFLLSLLGIGAGFAAHRRGATSLGRWTIGIGIISLIGTVFFAPLLVS
jgi:hypothetical protein